MLRSVIFEQAPPAATAPGRVDVALFVGFCAPRLRNGAALAPVNAPVLLDAWGDFDRRFAWDERRFTDDPDRPIVGGTYLGAAVRSFFVQGGRRCYVVAVDAPGPLTDAYALRRDRIDRLIPGFDTGFPTFSPVEADTWRSAWWLWDLPDVSFLCLPDLADVLRADPPAEDLDNDAPISLPPEQFVDCSAVEAPPLEDVRSRLIRAPRLDEAGYVEWARAVRMLGLFLRRYRPDVQLVAALPIPVADLSPSLIRLLDDSSFAPLRFGLDESGTGVGSAWVQLTYPWLRTRGSDRLPDAVESPDGVLTGMLARNALTAGTFRSAVKQPLVDVYDLFPALSVQEMVHHSDVRRRPLVERISLFGRSASQLALLADVAADVDEGYRQAHVNRLMSLLVREARRIGTDAVFEPSGEATWAQVRGQMEALLRALYRIGALNGNSERDAFEVRCDRTTMTQNDIDNGRLICTVSVAPAAAIEQIRVVLSFNQNGLVSLLPAAA